LFLASLLLLGVTAPAALARVRGREFPIPTAGSQPYGIAAGLNSAAMWFTEYLGNKIGAVSLR
jgi:streptogramin lyase